MTGAWCGDSEQLERIFLLKKKKNLLIFTSEVGLLGQFIIPKQESESGENEFKTGSLCLAQCATF